MPPKRDPSTSDPEDDPQTPKRTKATPSTPKKPKATPKKKGGSPTGGKRTGAWSRDELMRLYGMMCPKRTGVNWAEVAEAVGARDAKSCQNKKKIDEAIGDLVGPGDGE